MRISAGRWRARTLEVPEMARPTAARAREALFDLLGPDLAGTRFLDLYAGSGAIGIEAVSRGAARAVLVDRESAVLERNVARLGYAPDVAVLRQAADDAVRALAARGNRFDVIFADPPYGEGPGVPAGLEGILAPEGVVVLQLDADADPPQLAPLSLSDVRTYGRNRFAFYRRIAVGDGGRGGPRTTR